MRELDEADLATLRRALGRRIDTGWSTVYEAEHNSELYRVMRDMLPGLLVLAEKGLKEQAAEKLLGNYDRAWEAYMDKEGEGKDSVDEWNAFIDQQNAVRALLGPEYVQSLDRIEV